MKNQSRRMAVVLKNPTERKRSFDCADIAHIYNEVQE
jgi:hypothetical protein